MAISDQWTRQSTRVGKIGSQENRVITGVRVFQNYSCHWLQPVVDGEIFERRNHLAFGKVNLQKKIRCGVQSAMFSHFGSAGTSPSHIFLQTLNGAKITFAQAF